MRLTLFRLFLAVFFVLATRFPTTADIGLPAIFGDHMVLQQGMCLPIWGRADPGEEVTVSLAGQTRTVRTGADGNWRVDLSPLSKGSLPQTLQISGKNKLTFEDVLVGDVWIVSGQSNMEYGLQTDQEAATVIPTAKDSRIRMFFVPWNTALEPQQDLAKTAGSLPNGKWLVCSPEILSNPAFAWHGFSAVGFYFASDLIASTHCPVGLIESVKGGTPAEAWTSISGLKKNPALVHFVETHAALVSGYPEKLEANPAKPKPSVPEPPDGGFSAPGNLFNAMIHPLIPYGIKGVIWYQGESNGDNLTEAVEYSVLFPRLIEDWREKWGQGDFPFLYVQLANFRPAAQTPSEGNWPWVREAQLKTLALPHTGMASATDLGDAQDIHPRSKRGVGKRLSLSAQKVAYGEDVISSGPLYQGIKFEGSKIRVSFTECGSGLVTGVPPWTPSAPSSSPSAELRGFGIAGEDGQFVWAQNRIEGETVVVWNDQIPQPKSVRYNWADNPQGNLYNKEGLPASPFRSDDWETPGVRR